MGLPRRDRPSGAHWDKGSCHARGRSAPSRPRQPRPWPLRFAPCRPRGGGPERRRDGFGHVLVHTMAKGITDGAKVAQGQLLGTVGEDHAAYPHLHIEFRKGSHAEKSSVHPLGYLPYTDTANFSAPVLDRF